MKAAAHQNVTVRLRAETVRKAKGIAAQQSTSVSSLVEKQIEALIATDEAYEQAKRRALELLDNPVPMGGVIRATREELHER